LDAFRAGDAVVMLVAFTLAFLLSGHRSSPGNLPDFLSARIRVSNVLCLVAFTLIWYVVFKSFGLYRSRRMGVVTTELWDIIRAVMLGTFILATLAVLVKISAVNRTFLTSFAVMALVGTALVRSGLRVLLGEVRRRGRNLNRLVIVGCGPRGAKIGAEARRRPELGYLLLGYIDDIDPPKNPLHGGGETMLGTLDEVGDVLNGTDVDEVVVALPIKSCYESIAETIAVAEELGVTVRIPADFFRLRLAKAYIDRLSGLPMMTLQTARFNHVSVILKRLTDIVASAAALVVLSPLFVIVAAVIKLDSKGPVFFVQRRVGQLRREFKMVKFRTMVADAEARLKALESENEVDGPAFKMERDPRVTRSGRILRKMSLDELPQIFNVLVGHMSIVGPRPLPTRDVERIDKQWQKRRFAVKPGLTCIWQANGRHEISFEHWMELDLQYIDNWSFKLDFEIVLKTIPAMLRGTGAS
jgi:exopolysaccharide biosynthesis polyprenyl glycosylphosphotransferase